MGARAAVDGRPVGFPLMLKLELEGGSANAVACRIQEIESKIGAGLIEEVIQVAEGELKLVDTMLQAKV